MSESRPLSFKYAQTNHIFLIITTIDYIHQRIKVKILGMTNL